MVVDTIISVDLFNLISLLVLTEMLIAANFKGFVLFQALESLVSSNFTKGCEFHGTARDNLAVILNLMNGIGKAIEFSDILWWHNEPFCGIDDYTWSSGFDNHTIELSREKGIHLIKVLNPLRQNFWKRCKDEIVG